MFREMWIDPSKVDPEYKVNYYVRGTNWKRFAEEGERILRDWWSLIQWESDVVLGRELLFSVPIGDGHTLDGAIDKLTIRYIPRINKRVVLISDYKDLAIDTELPTPTGFTTIGAVSVNDVIISGDGVPCRVIEKSHIYTANDCYRISFDDNSTVVTGADHLWLVGTDHGNRVLTTVQMREKLIHPIRGSHHLRISNTALELSPAELPIDPYVFGVWLGDGTASCGSVCKPLPALFEEIERRGYMLGPDISGRDDATTRTIYKIRGKLRKLGVLNNKHIPEMYLRASWSQRLELLQGLMDTDGHWNSIRKRCVLNTTNKQYALDLQDLVCTLGWKATVFATTADGFGKKWPAWQTWFTPIDAEVFRVRRPVDYRAKAPTKSRRRWVKSIEPTLTVPTQCIQVDSPDKTFLCSRAMIRTHNSNRKTPTYDYLAEDIQFSSYAFATLHPSFWAAIPGGMEIFERVKNFPRFGEWVQLTGPKRMDAGERTQRHYNRLIMAVNAIAKSIEADIFVPTISGETCRWCSHRKPCGLPELDENGREI